MSTAGISLPFSRPIEIPNPLRFLDAFVARDMAMDLGTANTLIYVKNRGIVLNEPSVVSVDEQTGKAVGVGQIAKDMFGKTGRGIRCIRPMKDGVIADFEMTSLMINFMISQVYRRRGISKPRIVIGVPSGITQVEKRAVIDAALRSGVRDVLLVEESMAAALGADLPVNKPVANMIVDIGGGTTEVAIISMNGTLYSHSIRVAGDEMDEAIQRDIKRNFGLEIGIFEAERIKIVLGSALPLGKSRPMTVFGRDLTTGFPHQIEVSEEQVRESLQESINTIISSVVTALEQTSAEIAQDIISRGIHLAGGGALLKGLAERLFRETGIKFHRAPDPLSCVVRGVGKIVDDLKEFKGLCIA
jgi:rod shape-determining protein MreB